MPVRIAPVDTTRFVREDWGLCEATVGYQGGAGLLVTTCGKAATHKQIRPDGDGNHPRYCVNCARFV